MHRTLALLFGLVLLALAPMPAHAQGFTKSTLSSQIGQDFPDNTSNLIVPSILRGFLTNAVNSFQQYAGVNAQVGTSYTIAASDYGQLVTFNNAGAVAVTLPQTIAGSFTFYPFSFYVKNVGAGTVTITPQGGSQINGASSYAVPQGQGAFVIADGTNYQIWSGLFNSASVPWSAITGTPTTIAGYGITNARTQLTAPTFYVNGSSSSTAACGAAGAQTCSIGSDSNNCLTAGTACLTLAHVYSLLNKTYDAAAGSVQVYLAHNTGTTNYAGACLFPLVDGAVIVITGDSSAGSGATVIQDPSGDFGSQVKDLCTLHFSYVRFVDASTHDAAGHINVGASGNSGHVDLDHVDFGPMAAGNLLSGGSLGLVTYTQGGNTISGGGNSAFSAQVGGIIDLGGQAITVTNATVTITIAAPGVITWTGHGLTAGSPVGFSTTGALPTGLSAGTIYYVANDANLTANTFDVSDTSAHALAGTNQITTSGSQSGTQTGMPAFVTGFAIMTDGGSVRNASGITGSATGPRCFISGAVGTGNLNPNSQFPGSANCVMTQIVGALGVQVGSTVNYGSSGQCLTSQGGGGNSPNVYTNCSGAGVPQNNLNTQSGNYTIQTTDCGNTINETGAMKTITLPAVAGFATNCVLSVYNASSTRGQLLSGFPGALSAAPNNVLWMLDTVTVEIVNGAWSIQSYPVRHKLTASITVNVDNTNGNDANDCLSTTTSACKTIQGALNYVGTWDGNTQAITVSVADGTYTNAVTVNGPFHGNPTVTVTGDVATPANALISVTSATAITLTNGATISLGGFKITTTTSGGSILVQNSSFLTINAAMEYGAAAAGGGNHLTATNGGEITISASYTISGAGNFHFRAFAGGVISASSITITTSGTPAFATAFASAANGGQLTVFNQTYSGTGATGTRYSVSQGGVIFTNQTSGTYFPGNAAGTVASGGRIDGIGTPGVSSCGGSPGAASGTDFSGSVVEGSTATGCTITFTSASTMKACTVSLSTGAAVGVSTLGATLVVVHASLSGNTLYWNCAN